MIAKTSHPPPYYAVIFTSIRSNKNNNNTDDKNDSNHASSSSSSSSTTTTYSDTATRMMELAQEQPGFLGVESCREEIGITVSYWKDEESIQSWKANLEHLKAQQQGKDGWYESYRVRVAKVERDYEFEAPAT
ncbi:unnamed protein product [Cylindrotheca closterium]|uniref:ABM domain-containing protein n=1 Tax=Cylindrotheca closterium TaxID=2856 RepID=A0AAD2FKN6_9STRA|nr:unnamed protein product [Cylindrotheca closterium]